MAVLPNISRLTCKAGELRAHKNFLEGLPDGSKVLSDVMWPTPKGIARVYVLQKEGTELSFMVTMNRRGQMPLDFSYFALASIPEFPIER